MLKQVLKQAHQGQNPVHFTASTKNHSRKSGHPSPWDTPPLATSHRKKKILALDLDETLVYCRNDNYEKEMMQVEFESNGMLRTVNIVPRPELENFLRSVSKNYNLVIYTTGSKEYAEALVKASGIKKYVSNILHRSHCRLDGNNRLIKNLGILGVSMKDILLLDDSHDHFLNHPHNVLTIKSFVGDQNDRELTKILPFLKLLAEEDDVRPVSEKYSQFAKVHTQPEKLSIMKKASSASSSLSDLKEFLTKEKTPKRVPFECQFYKENTLTILEESILSAAGGGDEGENFTEGVNEDSEVQEVFQLVENSCMLFSVMKSSGYNFTQRSLEGKVTQKACLREAETNAGESDFKLLLDSSVDGSQLNEEKGEISTFLSETHISQRFSMKK